MPGELNLLGGIMKGYAYGKQQGADRERERQLLDLEKSKFKMLESSGGMKIPLRKDNPTIRWDRKHLKLLTNDK